MVDMKEKLVGLIAEAKRQWEGGTNNLDARIADHLIANGVTFTTDNNVGDKAPTVDAVEVVRCKACRQWVRNTGIVDSPNGHCFYHDEETNGYDFCSYGEVPF